jgi:hypothetical protein
VAEKSKRKYSEASGELVESAMKRMKQGTLRSGGSGKQVTDPKQAVAIGLSEARAEGDEAPPAPKRRKKSS